MAAAAYLRVSSGLQKERGSIKTQESAVREWAEQRNLDLVQIYRDEAKSGTLRFEERPGSASLLADASRGAFDTVVVFALDRLGRDGNDMQPVMLSAMQQLLSRGVQVQCVTADIDTTTPDGRFKLRIESALSAHEREKLLDRSKQGMRRKAREGGWLGGGVPYGYRVEGERGDATLRFSLVEVAPGTGLSESEIVRKIFGWAAEGLSCPAIADRLNARGTAPGMRPKDGSQRGIRTRKTAKRWLPGRVNRILRNPIYKGTHTFEFADGTRVERSFPALVSSEEWDAAQETQRQNRMIGGAAGAKRLYLLRGKIKCAACGTAYVGQSFMDSGGIRRCYYTVNRDRWRRARSGECPHKIIHGEWLEELVWSDIDAMLQNPGALAEEVEAYFTETDGTAAELAEERKQLEATLEIKKAERARVVAGLRRGVLTDDEADRELAEVAAETAVIQDQLEELDTRLVGAQEAASRGATVAGLLAGYRDLDLDDETRMEIVGALLEGIEVHTTLVEGQKQQRFEITYLFEAPSLSPTR